MRGHDRAALRAEAQRLKATVQVGHQGLTDTVRRALDQALRARELVKIQFGRTAPDPAKDVAGALAASLGAEVVQVIGKTVTLYRENPDREPRKEAESPWRD
jgi:RNA-binding protein